ncbi:MAG: site-specific DNA-methyltransferase [Desulfovibrio aminophilus]|uniref:site-specific DNA-methyltransferase n=1 Tax=Desulfovibrio aminophilus TaxID=81425 RepID=UPI0039EA356C
MEKMKMHSPNLTQENIARIREIFPNCVTEAQGGDGQLKLAVDFDLLRQELSESIVEGPQERYHLDWPGKREALLTANAPIAKTLRPCREESVDFDTTKNLFIEGDNLDALKLLQETYLGKIKMIYIDPPYNTGNDFIYEDDFAESSDEFMKRSNQKDEAGNRLIANTESNGRFHSDWLSMLYPRLKVAKHLLCNDGVIFISIDDGEKSNMKKICDEIFGEENFRNVILTRRRVKSLNVQFADSGLHSMNVGFEYIFVYAKSSDFLMNALRMKKHNASSKGTWNVFWSGADRPTMRYELLGFKPETGQWRWSKEKALEGVDNYNKYLKEFSNTMSLEDYWRKTGENLRFVRRIENGIGKNGGVQYWISPSDTALRSSNWTDIEVSQIRKEFDLPFDNPKSIDLMIELIRLINEENFVALDFFSGSSTTADAVMRLNAEDKGKRNYIMIQIPENCAESSTAFKAGFKNIAEVGKERIRQAGQKIKEESGLIASDLDVGFRVLKVDSSNMADVYYAPDKVSQGMLEQMTGNIKTDRTPEDLLFQVLLDWGVDLSLPIRKETIQGKTVFFVNESPHDLVACFDTGINEDLVKELAKFDPLRVVFRDNGFASDAVKINVEQIFKQMSPSTEVKSI